MHSTRKREKELIVINGVNQPFEKKYTCTVCGKQFRSKSHFDAICNLCWADNDMKPYVMLGRARGSRFAS